MCQKCVIQAAMTPSAVHISGLVKHLDRWSSLPSLLQGKTSPKFTEELRARDILKPDIVGSHEPPDRDVLLIDFTPMHPVTLRAPEPM